MWRPLGLVLPLLASCAIPAPPPPEAARAVVVEGTSDAPTCGRCAPLLRTGERTVRCMPVQIDGSDAIWRRAPFYDATVCFLGASR